jgi:two-component system response regulator HydG
MNAQSPVLFVDDEPHILKSSKLLIEGSGIVNPVMTLQDSRDVMSFLENRPAAVVLLDLFMPGLSGLELLPSIVRTYPHIPVIVMTAVDETDTAVECMKSGAFDYLVKPVESGRLISCGGRALELRVLSEELTSLKDRLVLDRLNNPEAFAGVITCSKKMRGLFQYVEVVAPTRQPVLITGETGVGKELFARAIHDLSGCTGEFVPVNAAGLDDTMLSDALFGHKRGAFTGADQPREGLIAKAAGGTLFLDEIGDLNEGSQIKLLRLLQEREYYPVGSDTAKRSTARIVVASNKNLKQEITAGRFRNDLYFRLCAHQVDIPPLRERTEDLPLLLDHFLSEAARSLGKKKPTPPPELAVLLATYAFPGNVRELQALVQDAVARHTGGVLSMEAFRKAIGDVLLPPAAPTENPENMEALLAGMFGRFPTIQEMEDALITQAMKISRGNQGIAAGMLGMTRQTLNKKLREKQSSPTAAACSADQTDQNAKTADLS